MFQSFQMYVPHVLSGCSYVSHLCCKCFNRMLHMFHTYVACVSSRYCICFAMAKHVFSRVSDVCCKCFNYLGCMLEMFPLDVAKVVLVLHMLKWAPSTSSYSCWACLHCVGVEGEPVAAWETVQVQIETERARDMERRMTPRKAGVRRIRPESYSFRWNLTYADLLREKNIIRSLKSNVESSSSKQ